MTLPNTAPTEDQFFENLHDRTVAERVRLEELEKATQNADPDDAEGLTTLAKMLTAHGKLLDDKRKAEKDPYLEGGRKVDAYFQKLIGRASTAKVLVSQYLTAILRRKQEEERAAQAAQQPDPDPTGWGDEPVPLPPEHKIKAQVTNQFGNSASLREVWEYEVVDPAQVPREYLAIDHTLIRRAVTKDKVRHIPGLRIYPVQKAQVR